MSLHQLLNRKLVSCSPHDSVKYAADLMDRENIGSVVVVERGKLSGILTDRDIVLRCVSRGLNCSSTPVNDVMSVSVETVPVTEGIYKVIETMRRNEIRRVPIVDENGSPVGLLSFGDVFQLVGQELLALLAPTQPEEPKLREHAA